MSQHSVLTQIRHTDAEKARENLTRPDATTRARTSRIQRPMECWPSQLPCSHGVYCGRKGMADGQEDVVADGMCFRFADFLGTPEQIKPSFCPAGSDLREAGSSGPLHQMHPSSANQNHCPYSYLRHSSSVAGEWLGRLITDIRRDASRSHVSL